MKTSPTEQSDRREPALNQGRRDLMKLAALGITVVAASNTQAAGTNMIDAAGLESFRHLQTRDTLDIGIVIFPEMDQIDFTGPFEVLVRLPGSRIHVLGTQAGSFRDCNGMMLTADMPLSDTPELDLLVVPGGPGQQALMDFEPLLSLIRDHNAAGKPIFSVCTGALICGAAGILQGRHTTSHWSVIDLLPYFGAEASNERVVFDSNLVSAAGVTAGIDGALWVAALVRGEKIAQSIQLGIQYAPEPPFQSGDPATAPENVVASVTSAISGLTARRLETAREFSGSLQ